MTSTSNPYAPPKDVLPPGAAAEEGVITCTVVLTVPEVASALLLTAQRARWMLAAFAGFIGFSAGAPLAGPGISSLVAAVLAAGCAALGWFFAPKLFVGNARKSLANKSEAERTFFWRFSPEGYEITTSVSYSRAEWSTLHRFVEGPTSFVLYASEAVVHVIPKHALRADDQNALRAMLTSRIIPRKKPGVASRLGWVVLLWALLILMFLAVWQFLQSDH